MVKAEPTELDLKVATLLLGVDTLLGGDALHESGTKHGVADTWFSGMPPPAIYHDPFAQAAREVSQRKEGVKNVLKDPQAIDDFVKRHNLKELSGEIHRLATTVIGDASPNTYNLTDALSVMLETILAQAHGGRDLPSFERRYHAATAYTIDNVEVADPKEAREILRDTLANVSYQVSRSRDLRGTLLAWQKAQGVIPPEKVAERARTINAELLQVMRSTVFSEIDFQLREYQPDLSDVAFDGHRFKTVSKVHFTGSSIYQGGEERGSPLLRGLFEYNTDHPTSEIRLYHLCAHEVIGHYLNAAVQDLLWRGGRLGFSATMRTMLTPDTVFQEGWAENIFELMYGSRETAAEVHGKDLLVALAHADLESIGKHNASILYQRDGRSIDEVRRHLAEDCVQADPIVDKLSAEWGQDPIFMMYGQAYVYGAKEVNSAIRTHGRLAVAEIGYGLKGQVDIATFRAKVNRLSE
ncbi:hypothetical protein HYX12_02830 [Candidatus Woesearchaeota archaeon]|nr:hypothetical protein [Candidatus Woesearchaeota archaeon]